jgi:hypothetical protein
MEREKEAQDSVMGTNRAGIWRAAYKLWQHIGILVLTTISSNDSFLLCSTKYTALHSEICQFFVFLWTKALAIFVHLNVHKNRLPPCHSILTVANNYVNMGRNTKLELQRFGIYCKCFTPNNLFLKRKIRYHYPPKNRWQIMKFYLWLLEHTPNHKHTGSILVVKL